MTVLERILIIPLLMEVNTRIHFLRDTLDRYNHQYYVLNCSPVTDDQFDALYRELVELEKKYPQLVDSTSPTQRVGVKSTTTGFKKVKHPDKKMLSLDNMRSAKDVINYLGADEVMMEPKIDGVSLKLVYQRGKLVQALTRGDGMEGDDVTANARTIVNVPLKLPASIDINVVGEVYMSFTAFNELNAKLEFEGQELMANPRNAASGAIKLLDPKETAARNLRFVAYGSTTEFKHIRTHSQMIDYLEVLNFQSVFMLPTDGSTQTVADCFMIESEAALIRRIAEADICRKRLDLLTDGLVFKLNDFAKQRELGEGTKYPKYACAFKFPPERKKTVLKSVTVQVGRTGKVTPVAELEPVLLSGTTVRRASLCNQDEINRLNVDVGDTVLVEKSAEIIPKVVGVAEKVKPSVYKLPDTCPCCGTKLEHPEGMVDSFCPNEDCDDQVLERLLHGCGKSALDIDGCGAVLVRELMFNGVRKLSDVFKVNPLFLKPAARKRFEIGRAAAPKQPFWRKLHALGIDGFGQTLCQDAAPLWYSLGDETADVAEVAKFQKLVGKVVFQNIADYCAKYADEIDALDKLIGMADTEQVSGPLKGKAFCITGDLMSGSRNEVSRRIEAAGGVVKSSVTRHVEFLIQGTETGRVKREKAEKLDIPVITETKLYEMMEQAMPTPKNAEEREY
jgi:DNA ligase (NAD+)